MASVARVDQLVRSDLNSLIKTPGCGNIVQPGVVAATPQPLLDWTVNASYGVAVGIRISAAVEPLRTPSCESETRMLIWVHVNELQAAWDDIPA